MKETETHNFGEVLDALKSGLRAKRLGWNGAGQFIWLMPKAEVRAEWCREPFLKALAEEAGGVITCEAAFRIFTAQGTVATGWAPSQTDMAATDWVIFE